MRADTDPGREQLANDVQRGRLADVVRIRFERESKDGNRGVRVPIEQRKQLLNRAVSLARVDVEDRWQDRRSAADVGGSRRQGTHVFGKAGAAPAKTRLEKGWTNPPVGMHRLTARATSEHGTTVETAPLSVTVIDPTLEIFTNKDDGTLTLVIPQGSLSPGKYDLQASDDLRTWIRLGEFEPGNVAAFYFNLPIETNRKARFYRSAYIEPSF